MKAVSTNRVAIAQASCPLDLFRAVTSNVHSTTKRRANAACESLPVRIAFLSSSVHCLRSLAAIGRSMGLDVGMALRYASADYKSRTNEPKSNRMAQPPQHQRTSTSTGMRRHSRRHRRSEMRRRGAATSASAGLPDSRARRRGPLQMLRRRFDASAPPPSLVSCFVHEFC